MTNDNLLSSHGAGNIHPSAIGPDDVDPNKLDMQLYSYPRYARIAYNRTSEINTFSNHSCMKDCWIWPHFNGHNVAICQSITEESKLSEAWYHAYDQCKPGS